MTTLHTVNKSPFTHTSLMSCVQVCGRNDAILLLEDGVFGALKNAPGATELAELIARGVNVFALKDDLDARGLSEKINPDISLTDYAGFVQLSINHKCVQSWY